MNRQIAPPIDLPHHLDFPSIHREETTNGFPIHIISGTTQDIFQLNWIFRAGRFFENERQVASLSAAVINKGTSKHTAYEIAEQIDFLGATLTIKANMYTAQLSLYCLNYQLPEVLPIVKEIMKDAFFAEKEMHKAIKKMKHKLAVNWKKNSFIAAQHFNQALFGKDTAFGYFTNSEDLDQIQRDNLIEHYQNHFVLKENCFAVATGNIGKKEIDLLRSFFSEFDMHKSEQSTLSFGNFTNEVQNIASENTLQAAIRIGMPSLAIDHEDYIDLQFVNTILGGYFGSRLMSNIREDKGYTYGIYSFINPIMDKSYFCIATEVGEQFKKPTLHEIEKEIKRLQEEAIGQEELAMVKNYLTGQLIKSVDGPLSTAQTLKNFLIFDQSIEMINKQLAHILKIDSNRIQDLANQYLKFDKMIKIVVG